jgi:hypothetical protein
MGASPATKAALYEAIAGLGFTTYTVTPQATDGGADAAFPHVQIGAVVQSVWDTNSDNGFDFTARIYTRWRGSSEAVGLAMQDAIYARLHHGTITITGYQLIFLERQMSSTTRLDGSFTGLCEYHALITEI